MSCMLVSLQSSTAVATAGLSVVRRCQPTLLVGMLSAGSVTFTQMLPRCAFVWYTVSSEVWQYKRSGKASKLISDETRRANLHKSFCMFDRNTYTGEGRLTVSEMLEVGAYMREEAGFTREDVRGHIASLSY